MANREQRLYDLHVHSVRSDGLLSLLQLVHLARRSGLAGLALTDHDVLCDARAMQAAEQQSGIRLLAGVELSTDFQGLKLHLLGYGFDGENNALRELCQDLQRQRRQRFEGMLEELAKQAIRFSPEVLSQWNRCPSLGRMHLARELVRSRRASSIRVAFSKYLEKISDHQRASVPLETAVSTLHEAGGVAVLAHPPARMLLEQWRALVAIGLDGVETGHPSFKGAHRRFLIDRVAEYGLLATAGSDYHGDEMNRFLGCQTVNEDAFHELLNRCGSPPQPQAPV